MAASASFTVTAKAGPGLTVTAVSVTGVRAFTVDVERSVLQLFQNGLAAGPTREFDISATTTFTVTISGGNYTVAVSQ